MSGIAATALLSRATASKVRSLISAGAASARSSADSTPSKSGATTTLTLYSADQALAELPLGPAEAVALASDLLLSARRRVGRAERQVER